MVICAAATVLPIFVVAVRFLGLPDNPESGFVQMSIIFGIFTYGPLILVPLLGFVFALDWKRELEKQMGENQEKAD